MKKLKIAVEVYVKSDEDDEEMLKQDVYEHIQGLIDEDDLEFEVVHDEDSEDEEEDY